MKKFTAFILVLLLALSLVACGTAEAPATAVSFTVVVSDLEGNETTFEYTSDKATVGEALLEEGLLAGYAGDYGLYITAVNGITLDWDRDGKYWACYVDGEYALTGVDSIPLTEGAIYSFKPE